MDTHTHKRTDTYIILLFMGCAMGPGTQMYDLSRKHGKDKIHGNYQYQSHTGMRR